MRCEGKVSTRDVTKKLNIIDNIKIIISWCEAFVFQLFSRCEVNLVTTLKDSRTEH